MKLLLDENLSAWLPQSLADLYPGSLHVRDIGLKSEPDRDIWEYAKKNSLAIVTKDSDFHERSIFDPEAPKIIWIRLGNCSSREIEDLLRNEHKRFPIYKTAQSAALFSVCANSGTPSILGIAGCPVHARLSRLSRLGADLPQC